MMSMLIKNTCHFQFQKIKISFSWHYSLPLALFSILYPALNRCRSSHVALLCNSFSFACWPLRCVLISLIQWQGSHLAPVTSLYKHLRLCVASETELLNSFFFVVKCKKLIAHEWFPKGMGMSDFPRVQDCQDGQCYLLFNSPSRHLCFFFLLTQFFKNIMMVYFSESQ